MHVPRTPIKTNGITSGNWQQKGLNSKRRIQDISVSKGPWSTFYLRNYAKKIEEIDFVLFTHSSLNLMCCHNYVIASRL
jgi:hypothetical protein